MRRKLKMLANAASTRNCPVGIQLFKHAKNYPSYPYDELRRKNRLLSMDEMSKNTESGYSFSSASIKDLSSPAFFRGSVSIRVVFLADKTSDENIPRLFPLPGLRNLSAQCCCVLPPSRQGDVSPLISSSSPGWNGSTVVPRPGVLL